MHLQCVRLCECGCGRCFVFGVGWGACALVRLCPPPQCPWKGISIDRSINQSINAKQGTGSGTKIAMQRIGNGVAAETQQVAVLEYRRMKGRLYRRGARSTELPTGKEIQDGQARTGASGFFCLNNNHASPREASEATRKRPPLASGRGPRRKNVWTLRGARYTQGAYACFRSGLISPH